MDWANVRNARTGRLAAVGAVGSVTLALAVFALAAAPRDKAPNPHWKPDTCNACHTGADGGKRAMSVEEADAICLHCHDGRRASMEFHPVARPLDGEKYARPEGWPLVDNRLACLTCHDVTVGCVEGISRPGSNRMMLRDFEAGRSRSQPFCQNCHRAANYQKLNPHIMLLDDGRQIVEEKCLFCHSKPPDRGALARGGKPSLKMDEVALCRDCHPQHKDSMNTSHVGRKLSKETLATMAIREISGLQSRVGQQSLTQAMNAGLRPGRMPPGPGDTMVCSTCHNPHQAGVFPRQSALSFRAMRLVDGNKTVSPVHNQLWCRHCHEF